MMKFSLRSAGPPCSHTLGMKTAISVPDETFEKASRRAHDLGMIRTSRPTAMACAMPPAALSAKQASPGDHLTVMVSYVLACQDTNPGGMTVTKERYRAVKIRLIQDKAQTTLATVDTDQEGQLSTQVIIPAEAQTGDAFVRVDYARDAYLTIK